MAGKSSFSVEVKVGIVIAPARFSNPEGPFRRFFSGDTISLFKVFMLYREGGRGVCWPPEESIFPFIFILFNASCLGPPLLFDGDCGLVAYFDALIFLRTTLDLEVPDSL